MNKLAKYFSWKLPNSEKIKISEFCKILENNLKINTWKFQYIYWSIEKDYKDLFNSFSEKELNIIIDYYELPKSFLWVKINYLEKMKNTPRFELFELLNEVFWFSFNKITFYYGSAWNNYNKLCELLFEYFESKKEKDETFNRKVNKFYNLI